MTSCAARPAPVDTGRGCPQAPVGRATGGRPAAILAVSAVTRKELT